MPRFRIDHYVGGRTLNEARLITITMAASDATEAGAEFERYCAKHVAPDDSANLVEDFCAVVRIQIGATDPRRQEPAPPPATRAA